MSGYIGVLPVPQTTQTRESFTATNGQTSFGTSGYQIDHLDVYLNGVKLAAADFTATNGSDIVLATGAALNDILEMVAFETFTIANQSFTGTTTVDTLVVTNTVDGRDVSVDGAKLDTIPIVSTSSTPSFTAKGDGSSQDGYIQLNCSQNSHGIKLKAPPHSANASYTLTFPNDDGNANQFLKTDGSGVLSWATDSTTDSTKLPLAGGAMTGAITTNSTFDGVDVATRDAVLTSTTTTAGAALPKAGGALTGAVTTNSTFDGVDIATRDAVLTSTTTTANAALPKAGGAMTGVLSVPDGSTSSPSITNTGDLDTGISFPAINSIAISTAGTQRLVIDSAGFFDVSATGNDVARFSGLNSGSLVIRNDTANQLVMHTGTSDSLVLGTGGNNDRLTIDANGNVGIGNSSPSAKLDVVTNDNVFAAEFTQSNTSNGDGVSIVVGSTAAADYALTVRSNAGNTSGLAVKADGKVGIGVFSPSARGQLQVHNTTDNGRAAIQLTSNETGAGANNGFAIQVTPNAANGDKDCSLTQFENANMLFHTNNAERMRIAANGSVGIGVSPTHKLHVLTTDSKGFLLDRNTGNSPANLNEYSAHYSLSIKSRSGGSYLNFGGTSAYSSLQATDGASSAAAKVISINPHGGNVGMGNTDPQELLHVASAATTASIRVSGEGNFNKKAQIGYDASAGPNIRSGSSGITTLKFFVDNTSLAMTIAANDVISGDFNDTSDVGLKENITDLETATTKLKQLKPRTFDWKKTDKENGVAGFIAQEVEAVIPKAVIGTNYENSGDAGKAINVTAILAYAIKTIQELEARIATLEG